MATNPDQLRRDISRDNHALAVGDRRDTMRVREKRNQFERTLVCWVCFRSFAATRAHARYCSDACRAKAMRDRKKAI